MRRLASLAMVGACLALGACGGDDDDGGGETVSAEDYAADVCKSAQDWVASLQTRAEDLEQSLGEDASAQEGKDALASFLDDVISDTDDWISAVEDAGTPNVDEGEQAAQEIKTAAEDAKKVLEDTRASVDDLPTDDEQRFAEGAGKVGDSTRRSLGKVGDAISEPESADLQEALRDTPACREIASG